MYIIFSNETCSSLLYVPEHILDFENMKNICVILFQNEMIGIKKILLLVSNNRNLGGKTSHLFQNYLAEVFFG